MTVYGGENWCNKFLGKLWIMKDLREDFEARLKNKCRWLAIKSFCLQTFFVPLASSCLKADSHYSCEFCVYTFVIMNTWRYDWRSLNIIAQLLDWPKIVRVYVCLFWFFSLNIFFIKRAGLDHVEMLWAVHESHYQDVRRYKNKFSEVTVGRLPSLWMCFVLLSS